MTLGPGATAGRARLARLVSLARSAATRTAAASGLPRRLARRPAPLRRRRRPESRHLVVEPTHRDPPRRRQRRGQPKELHFFDRSWEMPFGAADIERYRRYFPVPEGKVAGEWTPGYLIDFWTPELIARAAPDARVLVLLRDPVERFRSGLTHQLATSRRPLTDRDIQGAFQRGLYAPQLRRVMAAFPAERVWVGQYEACRADPSAQLAGTCHFLGLRPHEPSAEELRGEVNPTTRAKFEPSPSLRASLVAGYAPDMAQLADLVPGLDLSLWASAREAGLA